MAKTYKCGTERAPQLVTNMIQVADLNTPVVKKRLSIFSSFISLLFAESVSVADSVLYMS